MRIFERFREMMRGEVLSIPKEEPKEEKDPLTNYVRSGRITLEQMLNEIRYPTPRSMTGRRFREWLVREKNAGLLKGLDLRRLEDLNNTAKHSREPFLEWKDAEDMVRLARELLDVLVRI